MAGNYIVLNSKFTPFSYEELVKPVEQATQVHQAYEDALGELSSQASVWEKLANNAQDQEAYNRYLDYRNNLNNIVDVLNKQGLTPQTRKNVLDAKVLYNQKIVPIEEASKKRDALIEEQRKLRGSNDTLRFERNAGDISLDELINNPAASYGQVYNGAEIYKETAQTAANLQREYRGKSIEKRHAFVSEIARQYGASYAEVLNAMEHPDDPNSSFLSRVVKNVLGARGLQEGTDMYNEMKKFADNGLYYAIGQPKFEIDTDQYAMQAALQNRQARIAARAAAAQKKEQNKAGARTRNVYGSNRTMSRNDMAKKVSHLLNDKLMKEDFRSYYASSSPSALGWGRPATSVKSPQSIDDDALQKRIRSSREDFMVKELGLDKKTVEKMTEKQLRDTLMKYTDPNSNVYDDDTFRISEYAFDINDAAAKNLVDRARNSGEIFKEIKGYNKDGTPIYGKNIKDLSTTHGATLLGNRSTGEITMLVDGKRYSIASNSFDEDAYNQFRAYADANRKNREIIRKYNAGENIPQDVYEQALQGAENFDNNIIDFMHEGIIIYNPDNQSDNL